VINLSLITILLTSLSPLLSYAGQTRQERIVKMLSDWPEKCAIILEQHSTYADVGVYKLDNDNKSSIADVIIDIDGNSERDEDKIKLALIKVKPPAYLDEVIEALENFGCFQD
jgi:hypothetical protein